MSEPYRKSSNDLEEHESEPINGGILKRTSAIIKTPHKCNPPGFFSCFWHGIKKHDVWQCSCGQLKVCSSEGCWYNIKSLESYIKAYYENDDDDDFLMDDEDEDDDDDDDDDDDVE